MLLEENWIIVMMWFLKESLKSVPYHYYPAVGCPEAEARLSVRDVLQREQQEDPEADPV